MVVMITGCSEGGIGSSLCLALADRGCTVVATARRIETMEGLRDKVASRLRLDVTDQDSIKSAVQHVLKEHGQIDVLINNAGCSSAAQSVAGSELALWKAVYDVNVFGLVAVTQAVAPHMIDRRKGRIINIGSCAGYNCIPFAGIYCSSKSAVHSLTQALRLELRPFGIQVMLVTPGVIRSHFALNARGQPSEYDKQLYGEEPSVMKNMHFLNAFTQKPISTNSEVFAYRLANTVVRRWGLPTDWATGLSAFSIRFASSYLPSWIIDWQNAFFTGLLKMDVRETYKHAVKSS